MYSVRYPALIDNIFLYRNRPSTRYDILRPFLIILLDEKIRNKIMQQGQHATFSANEQTNCFHNPPLFTTLRTVTPISFLSPPFHSHSNAYQTKILAPCSCCTPEGHSSRRSLFSYPSDDDHWMVIWP